MEDISLSATFYNPYTPGEAGQGWSYGFFVRDNDEGSIRVGLGTYEDEDGTWRLYWRIIRYTEATDTFTTLAQDYSRYDHSAYMTVGRSQTMHFIAKGRYGSLWVRGHREASDIDLGGAEGGYFGIATGLVVDTELEGASTWYENFVADVPVCEGFPPLPSKCE